MAHGYGMAPKPVRCRHANPGSILSTMLRMASTSQILQQLRLAGLAPLLSRFHSCCREYGCMAPATRQLLFNNVCTHQHRGGSLFRWLAYTVIRLAMAFCAVAGSSTNVSTSSTAGFASVCVIRLAMAVCPVAGSSTNVSTRFTASFASVCASELAVANSASSIPCIHSYTSRSIFSLRVSVAPLAPDTCSAGWSTADVQRSRGRIAGDVPAS